MNVKEYKYWKETNKQEFEQLSKKMLRKLG